MNRSILFMPTMALGFLLISSCGGGKASRSEADSQAFDSIRVSAYSGYTAVAVTQHVQNYDSWLKAYSDVSNPESRLSIYASPDDPNLITVFELTRSHQDARNNFASAQQKDAMQKAGVVGEPAYQYYDIKFRTSMPTNKHYRLGVSHAVEDYDRWKKVFDEDEPIRSEAELELRAISTNADDPTMVNIMFATDDIEKAKNLINTGDLKKRMHEAGVLTEPSFSVFKVPAR